MAEAKAKKSESAKKIVDVKNSGDGASGTSRPVIVTNRPIMKDPMMAEVSQLTGGLLEDSQTPTPTGDAQTETPSGAPEVKISKKVAIKVDDQKEAKAADTTDETTVVAPSKKKLVIKPLSDKPEGKPTAKSGAKAKEPTIAELAMPDAEEVPDAAKTENPQDVTSETAKAPESAASSEAATTDEAPSDQPAETGEPASGSATGGLQPGRSFDENEATSTAVDTEAAPEQIELDAKGKPKAKEKQSGELSPEQQKAVENGEYFLPITTAETRRLRREIVFSTLFVIVLIVVWLDVMLDAELLSIGNLKAVTNFF